MPSLNLSLPAISVLGPGLMPVAANPISVLGPGPVSTPPEAIPSAMPVTGEGFAALVANAGAPTLPDAAPALKPSLGTPLPPERQDVAADPAPLPAVEVEAVMVGSAAVPPQPQAPTAPTAPAVPPSPAPQAEAMIDLPTECPAAPVPAEGPIACGLQTWQRHGASHIILARAVMRPVAPGPIKLPAEAIPGFGAVEPGAQGSAPKKRETLPGGSDALPPLPTLPFAPVAPTNDVRPEPAASADPSTPSSDVAPALPARQDAAIMPLAAPSPAPLVAPLQAVNDAAPPVSQSQHGLPADFSAPAPAAAPADQARQQSEQPLAAGPTPVQAPPAPPAHAAAPLPHGFSLPPELAREVAEIVRAATRNADDARPVTAAPVDAPASVFEPQPAPLVSAPLHPGFAPAHRPAIDTGRAEWMQAMIERIAEMPQADGNREAQIRLRPDALGVVDVKIVERQERLHVTLNAENPQARQLLADAAPRLHELAEARGLRLGQTGIGGGEQQERRPAPDQQPATPLRPRPASAAAEPDSESPGDLIA